MELALTFSMWLGPIGVLGALALLLRYPGKWRKRLGAALLSLVVPAVLLFPGNWLLERMGLAWRNIVALGLVLAMWAGLAAVLACTAVCLGEKMGQRRMPIRLVLGTAAILVSLLSLYWCLLFSAFSFGGERVIRHEGERVVEVDRSFLDPQYDYYAYRGPLVRGSERVHSAVGEGPWKRWENETAP